MKKIDIKFPSKEIKLSTLIILTILLILSVYIIFSSISGKEIISVQSGCTHRGSFNYVVALKPSRIKVKEPDTTSKIDINKVLSQHKDIIVEGMGLDGDTKNNIVQYIKSMDDLVKIADDLVKPIIHIKDYDRDIFYVLDINIRYEYVVYSAI